MWDEAEQSRWQRHTQAMVNSAASNDPEAVAELVKLADWLQKCGLRQAVSGLRDQGYSWADIARPLGVTREATYQRFTVGYGPRRVE